tara:strand:- start:1325 stop:1741 length:417 start_codon:yes stop_codon:yes gene_type:complete
VTIRKTLILSLASIFILGSGYALGRLHNEYTNLAAVFSTVLVGQELTEAKFNYALVKMLDEGKHSQVSEILKNRMYTHLIVFKEYGSAGQSDEMKTEVSEVINKISAHHKQHPYKFSDVDFALEIESIISKADRSDEQ